MAILLPFELLTSEQRGCLKDLLSDYSGEVSQCSLHRRTVQLVLNDFEITAERGQQFLDELVEILGSDRWGTDLPIRFPEREIPPDVYASRYSFKIPYDPELR